MNTNHNNFGDLTDIELLAISQAVNLLKDFQVLKLDKNVLETLKKIQVKIHEGFHG